MRPDNIDELMAQPDIDGVLVGGASLKVDSFARIVRFAAALARMKTDGGDRRRAALVILDGWGCAPAGPGNAISLARTPVWDALWARYPHVLLEASGEAVGLPAGVMGNSEVGHLTIGAGRVIYQDLSRINRAVADGTFFSNPVLVGVIGRTLERGGIAPSDGPVFRRRGAFGARASQSARPVGRPARAWSGCTSTRSWTAGTRLPRPASSM